KEIDPTLNKYRSPKSKNAKGIILWGYLLLQFAVLHSRLADTAHHKEKTNNRRRSIRKRCRTRLPLLRQIRRDTRRVLERTRSILQWKLTTGSRVLTTGRRGLRAPRRRKLTTSKRERGFRLPTLLISLRRPRRTKPKLEDKQLKRRMKGKQPKPRPRECLASNQAMAAR